MGIKNYLLINETLGSRAGHFNGKVLELQSFQGLKSGPSGGGFWGAYADLRQGEILQYTCRTNTEPSA